MFPIIPFVAFAYFVLYAFAYSIPASPKLYKQQPLGGQIQHGLAQEVTKSDSQLSLEAWLEQEEKIALDRLLANIAPGGANAPDAAPGTVIASPSKNHPDYYYQWIRDAAITTSTLVTLYASSPASPLSTSSLHPILEAYGRLSHRLQHSTNPSGSFDDLSGLGEPKFHVDGSVYTENWGRPQRDGPALRALTLMAYLRAYNNSHPEIWLDGRNGRHEFADLYTADLPANSTIKADLEYVSHTWREDGFDLWEEIRGLHFFTAMVQAKALREGAQLASFFGDTGAGEWYALQAGEMDTFLDTFWSEQKGHLIETLNSPRSGLDCGIILGSLHGADEDANAKYAPHSDEILLTLLALVRDQRNRFPINAAPSDQPPFSSSQHAAEAYFDELAGVGIGRYPEDEYDGYGSYPGGGNPWFLCTSSVAEVLYRTARHLQASGELVVTARGLPFWRALLPQFGAELDACAEGCKFTPSSSSDSGVFPSAIRRLSDAADGFLGVVRRHASAEGSLSEQFHRVHGFEEGARDLTWSYGAFLKAVWARKVVV